ncbi:MAG: gamma-glutamylcyclotransferase [Alphaproteobacteria bacterium PA4]|nr:MAG: gamma-glutamylcyclotransferase [Alphaproteobacteria bacterium PA4]
MPLDHRLAVYGTLAPGRSNHHQLAGLTGSWQPGHVRGHFQPTGWGAAQGYPALTLDAAADPVPVLLFTSADLPEHWPRLDAFEGADYRRVIVSIDTEAGPITAWLYEAAPR